MPVPRTLSPVPVRNSRPGALRALTAKLIGRTEHEISVASSRSSTPELSDTERSSPGE